MKKRFARCLRSSTILSVYEKSLFRYIVVYYDGYHWTECLEMTLLSSDHWATKINKDDKTLHQVKLELESNCDL